MARFLVLLLLLTAMNGCALVDTMISASEGLMSTKQTEPVLEITVVYENTLHNPDLAAGWGFAALIEYRGHVLLFDTGADGEALLNNMEALHIDPLAIESVILSHNHGDHTGGLEALLASGAQPDVYVLPSFPDAFKRRISRTTTVIEATPGQVISEGIFTTGEMGSHTPEQALAIELAQGMVIVTGCAHPGIVAIVEHVKETSSKPIHLVMGGFHLGSKSHAEIATIVQAFRRLGVERVGPCHCTGEQALAAFAAAYGDDFVAIGTGTIIEIQTWVEKPSW